MVGAVAVTATVIAGVIAFSTWPDAHERPIRPQVPLALESTAPSASGAAVGATLTRLGVAAAFAGRSRAADERAAGAGGPQQVRSDGGGSGVVPPGALGAERSGRSQDDLHLPATPVTVSPTVIDEVADATRDTGVSLGTDIHDGSSDVAEEIAVVAPRTAKVLQRAGAATNEAVRAASDTVADVMRVLPADAAPASGR